MAEDAQGLGRETLEGEVSESLNARLKRRADEWSVSVGDLEAAALDGAMRLWALAEKVAFLTDIKGEALPLSCSPSGEWTLVEAAKAFAASRKHSADRRLHQAERLAEWLSSEAGLCTGLNLPHPAASVALHWRTGESGITCEFTPERYASESVARWLETFVALLEGFADGDARTKVNRLSLLGASLFERLVLTPNRTSAKPLPRHALPQRIAETAAKTPNRIAIRSSREKVNYGELDLESVRLAQALADGGVAQGDVVAIRLAPSTRMVETWLAILKLGAAYLPLNPGQALPVEKLHPIVS